MEVGVIRSFHILYSLFFSFSFLFVCHCLFFSVLFFKYTSITPNVCLIYVKVIFFFSFSFFQISFNTHITFYFFFPIVDILFLFPLVFFTTFSVINFIPSSFFLYSVIYSIRIFFLLRLAFINFDSSFFMFIYFFRLLYISLFPPLCFLFYLFHLFFRQFTFLLFIVNHFSFLLFHIYYFQFISVYM